MRHIFLMFLGIAISLNLFSQVKISEILAYEYNNQKNTFTSNVVGKESNEVNGSGQQSLIVIRLNRIVGEKYKYIKRKLKITALYEEKGRIIKIYEQKELIIPLVDDTLFVPLLIQKGVTELTVKADLLEEGKVVSTKKQFLVSWSGD